MSQYEPALPNLLLRWTEVATRLRALRLLINLRDLEVLLRSLRDKGPAVRRFLERPRFWSAFPLFFGDDYSDEVAVALNRLQEELA